jgi:hypothetical protein
MTDAGLKLRAADPDDMAVVAAMLQDSLLSLADVEFRADERRFLFVVNRFRWENCDRDGRCDQYERVNCMVVFEGVDKVERRGLDACCVDGLAELLTIEVADGAVLLVFAGGGRIRLAISRLDCHIRDLGEPWPTQWRPRHPDDAGGTPDRGPYGDDRHSP